MVQPVPLMRGACLGLSLLVLTGCPGGGDSDPAGPAAASRACCRSPDASITDCP